MKFALACEGITDQIIIENILCGFFDNEDLGEEIAYLQPPFDKTEEQQAGAGGWTKLFRYLKMSRFRDDVLNNEYIIIQIDTDTSEDYGIKHTDKNDKSLNINDLINNVIDRLVTEIEQGKSGFYQKYQHKIIFCICVYSIECWLLVYHCAQIEITKCSDKLRNCVTRSVNKKYRIYKELSEPFLDKRMLLTTAKSDTSLGFFLNFIKEKST